MGIYQGSRVSTGDRFLPTFTVLLCQNCVGPEPTGPSPLSALGPCSAAETWDADTQGVWPDETTVNLIDHKHLRAFVEA